MTRRFLDDTGAELPLICGAMYPCSNRELVASVVEQGAVAIIQPLSTKYAHGEDLRETIRMARRRSEGGAVGFNALVEKSSKVYENRMRKWVDIAIEEGIRFFITALGNPDWVVDKVHDVGGVVYHDVTERKWALKGLEEGVDGLICVNGRAGGHAGSKSPADLYDELSDLDVPLVGAGGVGSPGEYLEMLDVGYEAVQLGTRFIASEECTAHEDYKQAIVEAAEDDIVLTRRISGVPVSVIETEYVERVGTDVGPITGWLLQHPTFKHWVRAVFNVKSLFGLARGMKRSGGYDDYWQAGRSVENIDAVKSVEEIVGEFREAYDNCETVGAA